LTGAGKLRPSQLPPAGDWSIWTILAGRGFGKTRAGAEWVLGLREADGQLLLPMVMRLHHGSEDQMVDPLIAAAEGEGQAPAYRGMAYAVFEDLALGEFGNRIPNLTFEIVADEVEGEAGLDLGDAARALLTSAARINRRLDVRIEGRFPAVSGFYFGRPGSLADALAPLAEVVDGALVVTGSGLALRDVEHDTLLPVIDIAEDGEQARADIEAKPRDRQSFGGDSGPDVVEMGFYDVSRDYQAGLQRVRLGRGNRLRQEVLPAAMSPDDAKTLAARLLARGQAARLTRVVSLPWRALGVVPGMRVRLSASPHVWRVRELRFERFVMALSLERVAVGSAGAARGDGGRALQFADVAAGPTTLRMVELPGLSGGAATAPVVFVAGAGVSSGWRRAGFELSNDLGATFVDGGMLSAPTRMGVVASALPAGPTAAWDCHNHVDVTLLGEHMWLEGRNDAAVLAGANMALLGKELFQFGIAEAIGPGRFRLSRLLRGRRGTERAVGDHGPGEAFLLLDPPGPVALEVGGERVGQVLLARPAGAFDMGAASQSLSLSGLSLLPFEPVHLRISREGDDLVAHWLRRSRGGFSWQDYVDAPLAEALEAYRVRISLDGVLVREVETGEARYRYSGVDRVVDGGGLYAHFEIAQLSAVSGPGFAATAGISID
jgi:hypothetical protein